jgi:hypothetical protein
LIIKLFFAGAALPCGGSVKNNCKTVLYAIIFEISKPYRSKISSNFKHFGGARPIFRALSEHETAIRIGWKNQAAASK